MSALPPIAAKPVEDPRAVAAEQMEAYLWRQVLAEVSPEGGLLNGGFAASTFQEMFQGALADAMAAGGGAGLAAEIEAQMGGENPGVALASAGPPALAGMPAAEQPFRMRALAGAYAQTPGTLSVLPVDARRTSPFGRRPDPIDGSSDFHTGLDLGAPAGAAVRAAGGGRVVRAESSSGYGNMVVIDHGGGLESRYAHLAGFSVKAGDLVQPGDVVGQVGSTGRVTGPHLHFEVRRDGQPVDPANEISGLKSP